MLCDKCRLAIRLIPDLFLKPRKIVPGNDPLGKRPIGWIRRIVLYCQRRISFHSNSLQQEVMHPSKSPERRVFDSSCRSTCSRSWCSSFWRSGAAPLLRAAVVALNTQEMIRFIHTYLSQQSFIHIWGTLINDKANYNFEFSFNRLGTLKRHLATVPVVIIGASQ
jgi:hypothetical protein